VNGTGRFSGTLSGVNGTFVQLTATNGSAHTIIKADGSTFQGDIYHQGLNTTAGRAYRFYTQDLWCRSSFGANSRTAVVVTGSIAKYYSKGLDSTFYESISLASKTDGLGNTYYELSLFGAGGYGDAAGLPVDLVIFRVLSGTYRYDIYADAGKKATLINTNDNNAVYFGYNGTWTALAGGSVRNAVFLGDLLYPAQSSSLIGYGVLLGAEVDNNW
jgi:hypothetical protein